MATLVGRSPTATLTKRAVPWQRLRITRLQARKLTSFANYNKVTTVDEAISVLLRIQFPRVTLTREQSLISVTRRRLTHVRFSRKHYIKRKINKYKKLASKPAGQRSTESIQ